MRLLSVALCAAATLLPSLALAEARPADRLAPTLGYTSLVRAEGSPIALVEGRVDVWLQGDHATIRTRYRTGRLDPWYSLFAVTAGLGAPSENGPWPGAPRPGTFPVLLVNGRDLAPGDQSVWFRGPNPVTLVPFGFEKSPLGLVHRWRPGHAPPPHEVVWTVPYAGDTYGGVAPLDCSCGEPWTFAIAHTYLVVDPSRLGFAPGSAAVELHVRNASGGLVELRSIGGARTLAKLAPGATWTGRLDAAGGAEPWMAVFLEGWRPGAGNYRESEEGGRQPWPSSHAVACSVAAVDGGEDLPGPDPKRGYDLVCTGRAGGRKISETIAIPVFLRRAILASTEDDLIGQGDASPGRHWFAAGLYRQLLAEPAPKVAQWPALDASEARRLAPERYHVRASASVPGERNGVERLGDGDPDTAWCAPAPAHGRTLTVTFAAPTTSPRIGILPGFVRAPWLYEANAMPVVVRTTCESTAAGSRTRTRVSVTELPALRVPDLYREGVLLPIAGACTGEDGVTRMTLEIAAVGGGTYSGDVCVSELVVLAGAGG